MTQQLQKLEGTLRTGPMGWLHLWLRVVTRQVSPSNLGLEEVEYSAKV